MQAFRTLLLLATAGGVVFAGPAGGEAPDDVAASASGSAVASHGHKWGTDPALRTGMRAIRAALAAKRAAIHAGTLQPREYQSLGATIAAHVKTILAECTLVPAADADLHPILAALIVAATAMQGPEATTTAARAEEAVAALNRYGQLFDDHGWRPLDSG